MQQDRRRHLHQRLIRSALTAAAILQATHARGDPAGGDPQPQPVVPEAQVVRARFASTATVGAVEIAVCALRPISMVDTRGRELDMQLPTRRCRPGPTPDDVIPVVVKVEQADGGSYVVIEAQAPPDASLDDLRAAITDMGFELKQRLEHPPPAPVYVPPQGETPEMETKTVWYGSQTLAVDGISAAACATVFGLFVGVPGLVFGAPIVHWVHGRIGIGFASMGMRMGMAAGASALGAAIGAGIDEGCNHTCRDAPAIGAVIGIITGAVGAIALDAIYLAYEEKTVPRAVRLFPSVSPVLGGATGVLVGVF
jgi:hypothetical protein